MTSDYLERPLRKLSDVVRVRCWWTHDCRSPIACGAFGYCRERNLALGMPDSITEAKWRKEDCKP